MFESLKTFFSSKSKPHSFTPLPEEPNLSGIKLINQFSTPDEPKVVDYPKGKYTAFWEILVDQIPGGYIAVVRFYGFQSGGLLEYKDFLAPTVAKLKPQVNEHIVQTMRKYER